MPSSRGSSQPGDQTCISCISCVGRRVLYHHYHLESPGGKQLWPRLSVPWGQRVRVPELMCPKLGGDFLLCVCWE